MGTVMAGHHGTITVADVTTGYDSMTGEITAWEMTIVSDKYDSTPFSLGMTSANVEGYKEVTKGMYQGRGSISGFWDTVGVTTAHEAHKASRAGVACTFVSREGPGAAADQSLIATCQMNNFSITVNKQSGLVSFSADVITQGAITVADYAAV